jgi:hypothetical protein
MIKTFSVNLSILFILSVMALAGCSSGAPSGTDTDVKELVLQIARDEIRNQITQVMYQKVTKVPVGLLGMKIDYDSLMNSKDKDKNAEVLKEIDGAMEKMSISLENIRPDSVDDKLKKSKSSADLVVNGKKYPISYTAQYNSDGELYVEVYGLR